MSKQINTTGAALSLNPQAIACVAACIGSSLGLAILKDHAIAGTLEVFAEDCRAVFCADAGLAPTTGFATMQKMKPAPKGLSTFYGYLSGLRRMLKAKVSEFEILAASAREVNGTKSAEPKRAKVGAKVGAAPEVKPLTIDDAIAAIVAAHRGGALTAAQYEALASIKAPTPATIIDMGAAVEVPATQLIAH